MPQNQKKPPEFKYVRLVTVKSDRPISALYLRDSIKESITAELSYQPLYARAKVGVRNVDTDEHPRRNRQ